MNLNKNLRSEKNINDISPTSEKTSFGKLYALILSVLLIVMCIGQFFFPVIKINSSSDKNKLKKAINSTATSSESEDPESGDSKKAESNYKYEDFLSYNNASGLVMLNEGDYLEPDFFISYNLSKFPVSFNDEKRLDSVIENIASVSNESNYNFNNFINYDIATLITKKDLQYFITGTSESFITVIDNTKDKETYEYAHLIGYDMLKAMKNEAESREFVLNNPYSADELKTAVEHYLDSDKDEKLYNESFPKLTIPYSEVEKIVENVIANAEPSRTADVLKTSIYYYLENEDSEDEYKNSVPASDIPYDTAKNIVENDIIAANASYNTDELKIAIKHYLESEDGENGYKESFPPLTVPYSVVKYIVENEIADNVTKNGILESAVENAASATSEADYKYSIFLCYERAKTVFENSEGAYLLPKTNEEMIGDAMTNALRVGNESEYEFSDILDYHVAKSIQKIGDSYQICNIRYSVPMDGKKYSLSLATLGFNSDYTIDISCDTDHSNLIISGIIGISFICIISCIIYVILGIMQLSKNTNKACTTLAVGFIPMIIAKLSLIIPVFQIKNFQIIGVESERIAIINDPAHASIILIISLIISICVPIISLKTIHRT